MGEASLILFDTDILIDAGRNDEHAVAVFVEHQLAGEIAVSSVTYMELLAGCRNKAESGAVDRLMGACRLLHITEDISRLAVGLVRAYRLSHGLLMPDAFIAATAMSYGCGLLTKNQRDYRFIDGLALLAYP
jgi:predicted nucleic acid-binding protein